jgi:hypothetical protein
MEDAKSGRLIERELIEVTHDETEIAPQIDTGNLASGSRSLTTTTQIRIKTI